MKNEYVFTFGYGQRADSGEPLFWSYVTVASDSPEAARKAMFKKYGSKWAHQYNSKEDAEVDRWKLHELDRFEA